MQPQFDNQVFSSFLLWIDHTILEKGQAYENYGSKFYPIPNNYGGLNSYGLPFKQIVADSSITGANILTGISLNGGDNIPTGVSGFYDINYGEGQIYFTSNLNSQLISGDYAVKDFNVHLTDKTEQELLFETKYSLRPKWSHQLTGLASNQQIYPAIYIQNQGGDNKPFAFGGMDQTEINVRTIILADSQFLLDACCSILRDRVRTFVPIFRASDMPYNSLGGLKSGVYNYNTLKSSSEDLTQRVFISKVTISRFSFNSVISNELRDLNENIFPAFVDFTLHSERYPRV